jgi:hypothetical protein
MRRHKFMVFLPLGFSAALVSASALASSPSAWIDFQKKVTAKCLAEMKNRNRIEKSEKVSIQTSPYGSESYGSALIIYSSTNWSVQKICIYDKKKQTVELSDLE